MPEDRSKRSEDRSRPLSTENGTYHYPMSEMHVFLFSISAKLCRIEGFGGIGTLQRRRPNSTRKEVPHSSREQDLNSVAKHTVLQLCMLTKEMMTFY